MIDTHAHIHAKQFDEDRAATIGRARAAGIEQIITVGCDLADSARALDTAREFGLRCSVGIHPHEAKDAPVDLQLEWAEAFADEHLIAIGEIGLDYYYDHSPRERQREVLRAQLDIAAQRKLPVIFHQRDAYDDFLAILRERFAPPMRGVIHCFTGDRMQAQTFVSEFGLNLGIGGVLTFKRADALREAVAHVGIDALILETDCPYLAPMPFRGKRNEPAFIERTALQLAQLFDTSLEEVDRITTRNAKALFALE